MDEKEGSGWGGLQTHFPSGSGTKENIPQSQPCYHCHLHNANVFYCHLAFQQPHKVDEMLKYKNLGISFCMDRSRALYVLDVRNTQYVFLSLSWLGMKKRGKAENCKGNIWLFQCSVFPLYKEIYHSSGSVIKLSTILLGNWYSLLYILKKCIDYVY